MNNHIGFFNISSELSDSVKEVIATYSADFAVHKKVVELIVDATNSDTSTTALTVNQFNTLFEFAEKICKDLNIEFREHHKAILKNIVSYNHSAIVKCRQCGFTTMSRIYALWKAYNYPNTKIVLCYHNYCTANSSCAIVEQYICNIFHDIIKLQTTKIPPSLFNEQIKLENGSSITFTCPSALSEDLIVKNKMYDEVIFDECAFYQQDIFKQLYDEYRINGKHLVLASTPYTRGDFFYTMCRFYAENAGQLLTITGDMAHTKR